MAETLRFQDVKQGMRARVVSATCESPDCRRLQEMGLTQGAEFTVLKVAPLGDPIEILLRGYRLCLRRNETHGVVVEVLEF
ncbi:MAG: FeoA domain-containing protein [Armatimonadetes bacterium]|nr:FeoA domain-containing protein [Armatimonadota bacterium]